MTDFYCPHCGASGSYEGETPRWWPICPNCRKVKPTPLVVVGTRLSVSRVDLWAHHRVDIVPYWHHERDDRVVDPGTFTRQNRR